MIWTLNKGTDILEVAMILEIDPALVRKYSQPGPRYTSYPTALQFREDVDKSALLQEAANERGPLSLYFHLPFCQSLCWFCGCSTVITRNRDKADPYVEALIQEMDLYLPNLKPGRQVNQLHFGGGSPDFLRPGQLDLLCSAIHERFSFTSDAELSVEIDPRVLSEEHVEVFARHGFTRASFGVQDSDPDVQKAIHRIQPPEINFATMDLLRRHGFRSVNVDLIYGLPLQTLDSFDRTLAHVLELKPDRLAVFSYAHVPWMKPAQKNLERKGPLPSPEEKLSLLIHIIGRLTSSGYSFIGMDHFAKPSDELTIAQREGTLQRNFQGYSTRSGLEICGFGVTSISQTTGSYRQNIRQLPTYYKSVEEGRIPLDRGYILTQEDKLRRQVIMRLMCDLSLNYHEMSERLGVDFETYFAAELNSLNMLEADGLLERKPGKMDITPLGRLLIRNIAMRFDAYFQAAEKRHSQTI